MMQLSSAVNQTEEDSGKKEITFNVIFYIQCIVNNHF